MEGRPTLRAQWLGKHLRDLRDAARLKLTDAAEHIQRDSATVSRFERGLTPPRTPDVLELLNLYGVDDPVLRDGLEDLSREIWRKGWWDGYKQHMAVQIIDAAWLESRTERLRDFSTLVLPGLLQTPEYAEAIMRAADPDTPEERVQSRIEFRMRRQQVLTQDEPLPYRSILDEATVHRAVGGAEVMRAQLQHLLDASDHPNVTIRVLPFATGAPASPEGAFALFTMAEPFSDVAQINTEGGAIYLETPEAERFDEAYTRLEQEALSAEDSRAFIKSRMEQLE
ncbi:MAG: helix-turn-helix domain-containing protein [Micromonosporaceae bacterium]|nr:helix-turn-helix domain-containing protein [Micromonosporaceae bacterium]